MLRNAVRRGVRAGLKVAEISVSEGVKVLRPLVRGGKLSGAEAKRAARALIGLARHHQRKADALIQRKVTSEIKRLGFVHRSDLKKKRR